MSRPADWSPLRGSDPVPGDPRELERVASACTDTAVELLGQAARLRALSSDHSWNSEAGPLWRVKARQIAGQLERAVDRYEVAGKALDTYAGELERAQATADRARVDGQEAHREEQRLADAIAAAHAAAAGAPKDAPPVDTSHLEAAKARAHQRYVAAEAAIDGAEGARDTAAEAAAGQIQRVNAEDGLKDSRWDKAKQWVSDRAKGINAFADLMGRISLAAGLLAMALAWVPVLGQVLAAVALAATLLALVAHVALAVSGDGSWVDVGLDVFALATLGVGRAALAGVRSGAKATRALGVQARVDQIVASKVASRTAGGKKLKKGELRNLRRGAEGQARHELGMKGRAVAEALRHSPRLLPSPADVARGLDPRRLYGETRDALADSPGLLRPSTYSDAVQRLRDHGADALLDDDTIRALKDLDSLPASVRGVPGVADAADAARAGVKVFYGYTGTATAVDVLDKRQAFEGIKPYGERELFR